ncbi:MAG TPA: AAA family ATPase, partial [Clostridia bacterium]|nr:AAA family ATPase [Clostridia bacterium]
TFSVNCGAALAARGRKVLLVDADAGMRALDLMLSVTRSVIYDLSDVLTGRCEPVKAIIETPVEGLSLLPAPQIVSSELVEPEGMQRLCRGLTHYYDYVLIDSPAGIGSGAETAAAGADKALVVATPDPVCIRDADRIASILLNRGYGQLRLVINRVNPKLIRKKTKTDLDAVIDNAAIQLIGVVPEDERVSVASFSGTTVVSFKKGAAVAYKNIAARLMGEDVPLMKL